MTLVHLLIIALLFMLLGSYLSRRVATPIATIESIDLKPEVINVEPVTANAEPEYSNTDNAVEIE